MAVTLQGILQTSFAAYGAAHRVPRWVWRAAHAVRSLPDGRIGGPRVAVSAGPRDRDLVQLVSAPGLSPVLYATDQSMAGRLAAASLTDRPLSCDLYPAQ